MSPFCTTAASLVPFEEEVMDCQFWPLALVPGCPIHPLRSAVSGGVDVAPPSFSTATSFVPSIDEVMDREL
jgi:hypothetical protein